MNSVDPEQVASAILSNARDVSTSYIAGIMFVWTLALLHLTNAKAFKVLGIEFDIKYRWIAISVYSGINAFMAYKLMHSMRYVADIPASVRQKLFSKITLGGPLLFSGFSGLQDFYFVDSDPASILVATMVFGLCALAFIELKKFGAASAYQGYWIIFLGIVNLYLGTLVMRQVTSLLGGVNGS